MAESSSTRVIRAPVLFRRFFAARRGAVAIEFAIMAIPFFAIVFAIMETAIVFFAGQILDSAVANAGRLIRTGQVQQDGTTRDEFRDLVCQRLGPMFNCGNGLLVDVQTYGSFGGISYTVPVVEDEDGQRRLDQDAAAFIPGSSGAVVVVRAFYAWPVIFDVFGFNLANLGNRRLLGSAAVFRNEPFPW